MWVEYIYWFASIIGSAALVTTLYFVIKYARAAKQQVEKTQEIIIEAQAQTKETQKLTGEMKIMADATQALAKISALEYEPGIIAKPEFKKYAEKHGTIKRGLVIKKAGRNFYGEFEILQTNLSKGDSEFYLIPHIWFQYHYPIGMGAENLGIKLTPDYLDSVKENMIIRLLPGDAEISHLVKFDIQPLFELPDNLKSIQRIKHLENPSKLEPILTSGFVHIQIYLDYVNEKTVKSDGLYHHYYAKLKKPLMGFETNHYVIEGEWCFNKLYDDIFGPNCPEFRIPW